MNTEIFRLDDDLHKVIEIIPPEFIDVLRDSGMLENLVELVIDLGRFPIARFHKPFRDDETNDLIELSIAEVEVTHEDIEYVLARVPKFIANNRTGIERTLHRISAISARNGAIIGLTIRVGRAIYGGADTFEDILNQNKSVLIMGPPASGKTTLLRESARLLSTKKRVIIIDANDEITGGGMIPHKSIGKSRRIQVPNSLHINEIMIEAVSNHSPQVIIIDNITREPEVLAARYIAEFGIQLVASTTARTLENLLLNPTLSDLVGGLESVTLSGEEARRRGTQKTVLERRAPVTFESIIEIVDIKQGRVNIIPDVTESVDSFLRGYPLPMETRSKDSTGKIIIEKSSNNTDAIDHKIVRGYQK